MVAVAEEEDATYPCVLAVVMGNARETKTKHAV